MFPFTDRHCCYPALSDDESALESNSCRQQPYEDPQEAIEDVYDDCKFTFKYIVQQSNEKNTSAFKSTWLDFLCICPTFLIGLTIPPSGSAVDADSKDLTGEGVKQVFPL